MPKKSSIFTDNPIATAIGTTLGTIARVTGLEPKETAEPKKRLPRKLKKTMKKNASASATQKQTPKKAPRKATKKKSTKTSA